jgi:hypothetical protein
LIVFKKKGAGCMKLQRDRRHEEVTDYYRILASHPIRLLLIEILSRTGPD